MLPKMGVWLLGYAGGLIRLKVGPIPEFTRVDVASYTPPTTALAHNAIVACANQPAPLIGHCYRTWLIGTALAKLDGRELNPDLFFAAALLHDYGLAHPNPAGDFTLASAECAINCAEMAGLERADTDALADAICTHATIGISPEQDGLYGCYVQWGAMADLAGLRRWELGYENLREIRCLHPPGRNFK